MRNLLLLLLQLSATAIVDEHGCVFITLSLCFSYDTVSFFVISMKHLIAYKLCFLFYCSKDTDRKCLKCYSLLIVDAFGMIAIEKFSC